MKWSLKQTDCIHFIFSVYPQIKDISEEDTCDKGNTVIGLSSFIYWLIKGFV